MINIFLPVLFILTSAFGEESRIECLEDRTYFGYVPDQEITGVDSFGNCVNICAITTTCNHWSWSVASQECYLYKERSGLADNSPYKSGDKDCPCAGSSFSSATYTQFRFNVTMTSAFGKESRIECPKFGNYYGSEDYLQTVNDVPSWEDCGRICAFTTMYMQILEF